jgi:hypothetical protein
MNAMKASVSATALLLITLLVACSPAASASPTPAGSQPPGTEAPMATPIASPSPTDPGTTDVVTSPAQAAAVVFAANPMFSGIMPLQPDLIGQSAWYEASENGEGYSVLVTVGSGDCMAGCINRRTWTFAVARDGTVELLSEEGDEVEMPGGGGGSGPATIEARLVAGPVCPVEQNPPDPNCAPRAVANADVVLRDPTGAEVARGVSDVEGRVSFSVPAGAYYVEPGPVEGLMGQAAAVALAVPAGGSGSVVLAYDTGIR